MSAGAQRALVALEEAADEGSTEDIIEARPPCGAAAARPSGASELAPYDNILDHKKNSKATKEANMFKHLGYYLKEKRGLDIDPKELPYEDLSAFNGLVQSTGAIQGESSTVTALFEHYIMLVLGCEHYIMLQMRSVT